MNSSGPLSRWSLWPLVCLALIRAHPGASSQTPATAPPLVAWGHEAMADIDRHLYIDVRGYYAETASIERRERRQPAFMWGCGVQLSALAAATAVDPDRYRNRLEAYAQRLDRYWIEHNDIGGYNVLPDSNSADRYYDDNAWIVLAMLEIHELTGDQAYFDRAERTMRFVLSGGDSKLGDGLYWRETPRATKNTCTNAPAIVGLLRLHQVTKDDSYLVRAKQLYAWVNAHLQDPDDGLLWDNINLESRVDERKYSYNTALMIRANCLLHEIEKDPAYLKQANRLAEAAVQRWIDRDSPAVADSGAFAHLLIEALLAVDRANGAPRWRQQAEASVRFVHDHLRGTQGRYPARWDGRRDRNTDRMKLLDQASVARAFFVVAQAQSATDD